MRLDMISASHLRTWEPLIVAMTMALRLLGPKADDHGIEEEDAGHTYIFTTLTPSGEKPDWR